MDKNGGNTHPDALIIPMDKLMHLVKPDYSTNTSPPGQPSMESLMEQMTYKNNLQSAMVGGSNDFPPKLVKVVPSSGTSVSAHDMTQTAMQINAAYNKACLTQIANSPPHNILTGGKKKYKKSYRRRRRSNKKRRKKTYKKRYRSISKRRKSNRKKR